MSTQYKVTLKKIFAKHRIDELKFHYTDYIDAERCYNRLRKEIQSESERYYKCEITIHDRTSQRMFSEIEATR